MWSSVGSVGAVNPADIGKIVIIDSVAQLGPGLGGVETAPASAAQHAERIRIPKESATLRYPVFQGDLGDNRPGAWKLRVRYRDGDGSVLVQLMEVVVSTGIQTMRLELDSTQGYNPSNTFHVQDSIGSLPAIDFNNNVYYVVVTLTGPEFRVGIPPAIQAMQLLFP